MCSNREGPSGASCHLRLRRLWRQDSMRPVCGASVAFLLLLLFLHQTPSSSSPSSSITVLELTQRTIKETMRRKKGLEKLAWGRLLLYGTRQARPIVSADLDVGRKPPPLVGTARSASFSLIAQSSSRPHIDDLR